MSEVMSYDLVSLHVLMTLGDSQCHRSVENDVCFKGFILFQPELYRRRANWAGPLPSSACAARPDYRLNHI